MHNPNWKKTTDSIKVVCPRMCNSTRKNIKLFSQGSVTAATRLKLSFFLWISVFRIFFLISQMPRPRAWPHYQSLVSGCHHQGIPVNSFSAIPDLTDNMTQPSLTGCLHVKPGVQLCTALLLNARVILSSILTVAGYPVAKGPQPHSCHTKMPQILTTNPPVFVGFIPNTSVHIKAVVSGFCTQVSDTNQPGPCKLFGKV